MTKFEELSGQVNNLTFALTDKSVLLSSTKAEIVALFNDAFCYGPDYPFLFDDTVDKRPGSVSLVYNGEGQIVHVTLFEQYEFEMASVLYISVAGTRLDQQGTGLASRNLAFLASKVQERCTKPLIVLARTQNPMEAGTFRATCELLGIQLPAPLHRPSNQIERSALQEFAWCKSTNGNPDWDSRFLDTETFVSYLAYSRLDVCNMIGSLISQIDWTRPIAKLFEDYMRQHNAFFDFGDALIVCFNLS